MSLKDLKMVRIMKHKRNLVPVETSDGACYQVTINGADDVTIIQGADFDPADGVAAYDGYGDEIDFSFSPSEIVECEVGKQTIRYSATGYGTRAKPHFPCLRKNKLHIIDDCGDDTDTAVVYRTITVKQADPPTISGVSDTTIQPNTNFNPLNGVSAVDAHGNTVDVEYSGSYDLEASGTIATFDADESTGIKSLAVALEPIQSGSGTPSPDNVRAISGHTTVETHMTGRNLLNTETISSYTNNGVTFTVQTDGSVTTSGTASGLAVCQFPIELVEANYILNGCPTGGSSSKYEVNIFPTGGSVLARDYGSETTFTIADATKAWKIQLIIRSGQDSNGLVFKPMVRLSSISDATYEPYQGDTYTTDLGRTVYGGTLDVVSGVLTVDRAYTTITSDMNISAVGTHGWYVGRSSIAPTNTGENYSDGVICDRLKSEVGPSSVADNIIFVNSTGQIRINTIGTYSSASAMLTALGGSVNVVYPVPPQTYQLTPQEVEALVGTNTVWSDGNVTVQYSHQIPQGTFQYPVEGIYSITYTASDKCGNTRTETRRVYCATEIQFVIPSGQAGYGYYVGIQTVEPNKRYLVETNIPYSDTSELQFYNNYTPDNPGFIVYEGESVTFETPSSDGSQKQVVAFCNGALRTALENDTYRVKIYEIGNIYTSI